VTAIAEELRRLCVFEERHQRLFSRLALVFAASALLDLLATIAIYFLERHANGSEVHTVGQALFFTTVQLLTVSSQLKNPVTPAGRGIDVVMELWAIIVVAGSAGAVATFFQTGDSK
jgi:voltage-gated potassium channel